MIKNKTNLSINAVTTTSKRILSFTAGFLFLFSIANPIFLEAASAQQSTVKPAAPPKTSSAASNRKKFLNKKRKKTVAAQPKPAVPVKQNSPQLAAIKSQQGSAKIESFKKDVSLQNNTTGKWEKAGKNSVISINDRIKTGRGSLARVQLEDGSKVLLLQNSQAEISDLSTVNKTIKLLRGRIRAIVKKLKSAEQFKILTPIGVASVRGTDFEVGFEDGGELMEVKVNEGSVAVSKLGDLAGEVLLQPGQTLQFGIKGDLGDPIQTGFVPFNRNDVQSEVQISSVKNSIMTTAAAELREADYQVGKSLIDVDGSRVRVEEYIVRSAANQFKLVALNERSNRFDYFTYTGTFNKDLPVDLSVALAQVGGGLGTTAPEYYLTGYESVTSNTIDSIIDTASGGHQVKIEFDGTTYTLTDTAKTNAAPTKTIDAAVLQGDGTYKIYNPIRDSYSLVTAANLSNALQLAVLDAGNYRNLSSGDTYWKTRFNTNTFSINGTTKGGWTPTGTTNILAVDLDATFTNSPITTISEFPSGTGSLHNRLSLFYSDGTKLVYDNYIINDEGEVATSASFAGLTTGAAYQSELLNWNYQQKVTSTEMGGRNINLVIDPRIGTMSGLIQ